MHPRLNRAVAAALPALLAVTLPGCGLFDDGRSDAARAAGVAFLADWSAGNLAAAARRTTDPETAEGTLGRVQSALRIERQDLTAGQVTGCTGDQPCVLPYRVRLGLDTLGEWSYSAQLTVVERRDAWVVAWDPALVHPKLTGETELRRVRKLPPRAPILDRHGRALTEARPVVRIGVAAGEDAPDTSAELAEILDIDADALTRRVNRAPEGQFVEAIVLRQPAFDEVAEALDAVDGAILREDSLDLAPTREFARGVLGTVRAATEESLAAAGPTASIADDIGASGLQGKYQQRLAGSPGGRIELVDRADGEVVTVVHEFTATPGRPLRTTLDRRVQQAAQRAIAGSTRNTALVAIDVVSGGVLAVANGPADRAGDNRAFTGQYPPGSTFKVVTTTAALRDGLKVTDTVACPATVTVAGKKFENYDGLAPLGTVPFAQDFIASCNTAFVDVAADLDADALAAAARSFGLARPWELALSAFSGQVPTAEDPIDRAAAGIGQGTVLMSPLGMASVAAAVASGSARQPFLLSEDEPGSAARPEAAVALPEAAGLRSLMVRTVEEGTARVLRTPDVEVAAKTGTAEFATEIGTGLHAWMIGFADDVAFAVLVERGGSGAETAGPIAKTFIDELDG